MGDLERQLQALSEDTNVPLKARQRAASLFQRLTTPLRVAICGPDVQTVAMVAKSVPTNAGLLVRTDEITVADIAVWCTISFESEEVAFWGSAPPALQDHSFLVGPHTAHVLNMGASFFRQVCTPDTVVQKLVQQLELGREADADHAHALFLKHPPPLLAESATPALWHEDPILKCFQTQAEKLAALKIADTADSCDAVLTLCSETAHHLMELTTTEPDKALQNAVYDANDAITLMMIEGDISAATDAVTTLMNLKEQFINHLRETPVRQF